MTTLIANARAIATIKAALSIYADLLGQIEHSAVQSPLWKLASDRGNLEPLSQFEVSQLIESLE